MTFSRRKGGGQRRVTMAVAWCVFWLVFAGSCDVSNPVGAEPSPSLAPIVYEEPCNRVAQVPSFEANAMALYAEHEFPGLSAFELAARVTVVVPAKYPFDKYALASRLDRFDESLLFKDGAVAVVCMIQGEPVKAFDNVLFLFR